MSSPEEAVTWGGGESGGGIPEGFWIVDQQEG